MKTSRAYHAGRHVHNFVAMIASGIGTSLLVAKNTVVDFASGVKEGGEATKEPANKRRGGTATA